MSKMIEVTVPSVGESISEVQIGQWLKSEGDWVAANEDIVDLETEKASVQVPAPESGYLRGIRKQVEEFAAVGDIICEIEPASAPSDRESSGDGDARPKPEPVSPASSQSVPANAAGAGDDDESGNGGFGNTRVMPAAQRILDEQGLSPAEVQGTGPGGRLLKEDALRALEHRQTTSQAHDDHASARSAPAADHAVAPRQEPILESASPIPTASPNALTAAQHASGDHRMEEVKPLSMIRRTIAARLVEAQQTAALLTTFNEVNMQPIMDLRQKYRDAFQERHGVKLGFMSFFAKASVEALRRFPAVNAELRGNNIVYRHYHDIGIAIGGGKGLVVPILRNVEGMTFAEVERTIGEFSVRASENRLMPEDLEGGTFTISNGGVYGSMLSTPIVNPPQSAILGLHAIQDRPMAVDGQVIILPMMYLALTYDHRIIDGREAVNFLKTIKEICEDPTRLFLEV